MSTLTQILNGISTGSAFVGNGIRIVVTDIVETNDDSDDRAVITGYAHKADGVSTNQIGAVEAKVVLNRKSVKNGSNSAINMEVTFKPTEAGAKPTNYKFYFGAQQVGSEYSFQSTLIESIFTHLAFNLGFVTPFVNRARLG